MTILVLQPCEIAPAAVEILASEHDVVFAEAHEESVAFANVIWTGLERYIDSAILDRAPRLKFLATPTTGETHINRRDCEARGVRIVSLRNATDALQDVRATAEFTIALLLALLRNIPEAVDAARKGKAVRSDFIGTEIYGKTAGIIGYGRLGRLVAGYLRCFGAKVIAYDPAGVDENVQSASLKDLLQTSDIICMHASYEEKNRGLLGEEEFGLMKAGAYFINTARGELVDEASLLRALESGRLSGAALDVRDREHCLDPLQDPLLRYAKTRRNLLLTPHIGGLTHESRRKTDVVLARMLLDLLRARGAADAVVQLEE